MNLPDHAYIDCPDADERTVSQPARYDGATTIGLATLILCVIFSLPKPSAAGTLKTFVVVLTISTVLHLSSRILTGAEALLTKLASHRSSIFLVAGIGLGVALLYNLAAGPPEPANHDEFSYLLAGDTFAHGRLTNPTHPMWAHFETFHVIQTPSYASKYPPAEGVILAFGQLLGNPLIGVLISTALLSGALFWMLRQWIPAGWAFVGAMLACFHPELLYWGHSFWGGQLAMVGGALTLGAFRRLLSGGKARNGLIAGVGMSLMANTRPYEGLVLSLLTAAVLLVWSRTHRGFTAPWLRVAIALSVVLLPIGLAMGFYNYRVTGHWLTLPYQVHEAQYDPVPLFLWQKMKPIPRYNHFEFYDLFVTISRRAYDVVQTPSGLMKEFWKKTTSYADWYFLGFAVPISIVVTVGLLWKRDEYMRVSIVILLLFYLALLGETWCNGSHYFAPAASLCFLVPLIAMLHWRAYRWRGLPIGMLLTRTLVALVMVFFINSLVSKANAERANHNSWHQQRAGLLHSLEQRGGRQLIIVHYLPGHPTIQEWVYNGADIDGSSVVWARDMGVEKNRELINYFPDRKVWLLSLGASSGSCVSYNEAVEAQAPSASQGATF